MPQNTFSIVLILTGVLWCSQVAAQKQMNSQYYGDINVTVSGVKERTSEPVAIRADVYINGRFVGQTPYANGLPGGKYDIRVEAEGSSMVYPIRVVPGEIYNINARITVALSAEEQLEMQRQADAVAAKQLEDRLALHRQSIDAWQQEVAEIRQRRKPILLTAGLLALAGTGMTIAGSVFLSKYHKQTDNYEDAKRAFEQATTPEDIEMYRDYLTDIQTDKKRNRIFAAVFLPVGITSLVASLVFLGCAPKKPPRPLVPAELLGLTALRVVPFAAPGASGVGLSGTF